MGIAQKVDAAEMQKGKGKAADNKQKGGAAATAEGEEVKLSKKDLVKLAKKESKANAKAGNPDEPKQKGPPKGKPAGAAPVQNTDSAPTVSDSASGSQVEESKQ